MSEMIDADLENFEKAILKLKNSENLRNPSYREEINEKSVFVLMSTKHAFGFYLPDLLTSLGPNGEVRIDYAMRLFNEAVTLLKVCEDRFLQNVIDRQEELNRLKGEIMLKTIKPDLAKSSEELERRYIRRLFDALLTIPGEYWQPVTERVARMVEEGCKPGTTKYLEP